MENKKTIRILVVDDDPEDCDLISRGLERQGRESVEVIFAHSVDEACTHLREKRFGAVLVDHRLPDGFGYELLEVMEDRLLTVPVIGLAMGNDPEVAIMNFRGGASEFVFKDDSFSSDSIRSLVFDAISRFRRRSAAIAMDRQREELGIETSHEELIAAARLDALTGVLNRHALDDCLADLHQRMNEEGMPYAVCLIDIDHFKQFNDRYGHTEGDTLLRVIAEAIRNGIRPNDLIARFGGDELAVLLETINPPDATIVAGRLVKAVESMDIPHLDNAPHDHVTISAGVAVSDPSHVEEPIGLLKRSDLALYEAKASGRNQAILAAPISPVDDRKCVNA